MVSFRTVVKKNSCCEEERSSTLPELDYPQALNTEKVEMPWSVGRFFRKVAEGYNYRQVVSRASGQLKYGQAFRTENCTVVVFPDWGCSSQFQKVVNALRKD